jgi:pimeloyl-ACP methyl ester carboxylesterase
VILESGAGGFSPTWALVQPEIAKFTRVCTYDRAGYGRSDAPPAHEPRTADRAMRDLHTLLENAGIAPPYVLVGHSLGGFHVRLFASRYPDEVAGMVLLDANHEDEWTERFPPEHRKGLRLVTRMMGVMMALSYTGLPQLLVRLKTPDSIRKLPPDAREEVLRFGFRPGTLRTIRDEFRSLEESARQVREQAGTLDSLPLRVLRAGQPGPMAPGVSPEVAREIGERAAAAQEELASLSTRGRLITAERSGHEIHIDEPGLVVQAVREVAEAVRKGRGDQP